MSDFNSEWEGIAKAETSGSYISKAGVYLVAIKSYKMSPKDHKGVPYIEFTFETTGDENGNGKAVTNSRLYRVQQSDSDQKRAVKQKRIKELLQNAGGDFSKKGEEVINSAIGKPFWGLFKSVEYIGYNKDENNKPMIKTKIEYSFSSPRSTEIVGTQKYLFNVLNAQDQAKFEGELKMWNRDNGMVDNSSQNVNTSPTAEEYQNQGVDPDDVFNPDDDDAAF